MFAQMHDSNPRLMFERKALFRILGKLLGKNRVSKERFFLNGFTNDQHILVDLGTKPTVFHC